MLSLFRVCRILFLIFILNSHSFFLSVEVLKVRLQLANAAMTTSQSAMHAGLIETTRKIYQKEGIRVFYSGLMPAIVRGLFYGGVRLGMSIIELIELIEREKRRQRSVNRDI